MTSPADDLFPIFRAYTRDMAVPYPEDHPFVWEAVAAAADPGAADPDIPDPSEVAAELDEAGFHEAARYVREVFC